MVCRKHRMYHSLSTWRRTRYDRLLLLLLPCRWPFIPPTYTLEWKFSLMNIGLKNCLWIPALSDLIRDFRMQMHILIGEKNSLAFSNSSIKKKSSMEKAGSPHLPCARHSTGRTLRSLNEITLRSALTAELVRLSGRTVEKQAVTEPTTGFAEEMHISRRSE